MTIKACIIGCGFIAEKHVKAIAGLKDIVVHSLCDINSTRSKEIEAVYRSAKKEEVQPTILHFTTAEEALENKEIDVVIITVISSLHASIAKKAITAGKHVILEKPMALSLEEADELHQLSIEKQKVLLICHQLRYRPLFKQIKKLIEEDVLGTPYLGVASVRINRSEEYYSSAPWKGTWDLDGGMLINQGIHVLDLLQWFLGDVRSVYGEIGKANIQKETEDYAVGVIQFSTKARGIIEANTVTLPNNIGYSLSLFCEKGSISIDGPSLNKITRWYIKGLEKSEPTASIVNDTNDHQHMYEDFIHAFNQKGNYVLMNGAEGKKAIETIFSLYESSKTKQPIYLPLPTFNLASMKEEKNR
ncbi:Gfo/Idh/MocA family protein [Anaerobacillus isosaccharinicus]|uniref:Oxidoreductase n=1 Tax=Anaerobacillus isosaccharinicus TaxID=1532552 RepID=A0A1S2M8R9_9BACI|nr:Gfo/Idh/MocA family oxidoreductase [Anaerobacillus isosaccharinicus]MBA5587610.1 Gfo/Idh/MocA family oxidoreductase [Anaerobacillus isosaccharinicus]QOY34213.1 Gfo/Idh/MocA family oxidoreductase [Anaerobacillus isosaccharinicus]